MTVRLVDNRPPPRPPRERLFDFTCRSRTWRCDLITHVNGAVEAQFFEGDAFRESRNFATALDETRTTREMAIAWATEERAALEQGA